MIFKDKISIITSIMFLLFFNYSNYWSILYSNLSLLAASINIKYILFIFLKFSSNTILLDKFPKTCFNLS